MTTAREVLRLVLRSIDTDLELTKTSLEYAQAKKMINKDEKRMALASGIDYMIAADRYDSSIGFYSGMESECRDRIAALNRRREYYVLLDMQCAEEESKEAVQEDEGNE